MLGIAVFSYNRPSYLSELLLSLQAQTDKREVEMHIFQDGAYTPKDNDLIREAITVAETTETGIPTKLHTRNENVCIGIALSEAIETMGARYDRLMMIEDDVVLSPHWLHLAHVLYGQLEDHLDVYAFSPGFKRRCSAEAISEELDTITVPDSLHMWCECTTPDRWARIQETYRPAYARFLAGKDYRQRDHQAILRWCRDMGYPIPVTSHDGMILTAMRVAGMCRVQPTVNRAMGIGERGLHFTDALYAELGFGEQMPYVFESDATRERFIWD
jgi:hypothetical protein